MSFPIHSRCRCNTSVTLNSAQARALIGPGGAGVKKLRADTGADISVEEPGRPDRAPKDKDAPAEEGEKRRGPRPSAAAADIPAGCALVTIRGEPDKVQAALAAVKALVSAYTETRLAVNGYVISALINNKGEVISGIQKDTGAQVDIIRETPPPARKEEKPAAGAAEGAKKGGDRRSPARPPQWPLRRDVCGNSLPSTR